MTLQKFLKEIEHTKNIVDMPIVCFFGKLYPLLFFYYLFVFFKKNDGAIEHISCDNTDVTAIKAILSTASLSGIKKMYWLESFHVLSAKKQQELWDFFLSYAVPHTILFFSHDTSRASCADTKNITVIEIPDKIASSDFSLMRFLVNNNGVVAPVFSQQLSDYTHSLSVDSACLFAYYESVIGKNVADFFSQWVTHIIEPTTSLFTLSQYFFNKKQILFYKQWAEIAELYAPSFWATFWADQLWRAYIFCDLMKNKKHAEGKKAQYKLPFSFINRDWTLYSATELRNAHQFLFALDYRLKNGGSEIGLEHFYDQFFTNKFKIKKVTQ